MASTLEPPSESKVTVCVVVVLTLPALTVDSSENVTIKSPSALILTDVIETPVAPVAPLILLTGLPQPVSSLT